MGRKWLGRTHEEVKGEEEGGGGDPWEGEGGGGRRGGDPWEGEGEGALWQNVGIVAECGETQLSARGQPTGTWQESDRRPFLS